MKYLLHNPILKVFFLLTILSFYSGFSQEKTIISSYKDYTEAPREVVYLHLNKSTYIKGEDIGFTAYVINKQTKKPSLITTNLYVSLEDQNNNVIKQLLLKVENGISSNIITIDSTYSSGKYTVKAYTNWMRNFREQGAFIESIKIIDQDETKTDLVLNENLSIDAQFLPEGGHLLNNVVNSVGVVLKDTKGFGIGNLKGSVFDKNKKLITEFKVNHLGIGRFLLLAEYNNNYTIKIYKDDKEHHFILNENIEPLGVTLSVVNHRNKAIVTLITNKKSLTQIKNKPYSLALHNGKNIGLTDVIFKDKTTLVKVFDLKNLPSGMNVFTLFNENNEPIVERLFFNYNGIKTIKSQNIATKQIKDSLDLKLHFKQIDPSKFNNISISVLPQETESYKHHNNILSYTFLKPYVKGYIEQAKYYFTDINEEKKLELDNLLITQGWSSYDWKNIFNNANTYTYPFEQGITIKANFPSRELDENGKPSYVMYYLNGNNNFMISEAETDNSNYWLQSLFPEEKNTIKLSEIKSNNKLKPSNLYLQFFPRQIPKFSQSNRAFLGIKEPQIEATEEIVNSNKVIIKPLRKVTALDEVLVKSNPVLERRERENQLSRGEFGKVSVVTEEDENTFITLRAYLSWKAWNVGAHGPNTPLANINEITTNDSPTGNDGYDSSPRVNYFLNDNLLIDLSPLDDYFLSDVDYIVVNRFGIGDGMRSPHGLIKIYTKDPARRFKSKEMAKEYQFPITFSKEKKFYAPKYRYYNDDFYKKFGTIAWIPNLAIDANGNISTKITKPEVPFTLFIEGIANDGTFILEKKSISLN